MFRTQIIAPLRAEFLLNGSSAIRYLISNGTFLAHWDNVLLENNPDRGQFR